jgi:hypothetical protein
VSAAGVLEALRTRGVELRAAGDRLRFRPVAAVTPDELAALRAHKAAVLALLADLEQLERDGTAAKLRAIGATLTSEEHQRLRAEAAAGDRLAELVTAVLTTPLEGPVVVRCRCGAIAWHPEPDRPAERCVECGAWSPVSVGVEKNPL